MLRSASLLALFTACTANPDSGLGGEDSADTGSTADSEAQPADCSFVSIEPLVTSWNGGDEVTVSMDCANPGGVKTMTVSLNVARIEVSGKAADDGTWTGTFAAPAMDGTGPQAFDLEVQDGTGTETVEGDILRFRLDPDELGQGVEMNKAPSGTGWGLPIATTVVNQVGRQLVVSPTEDSVVVGLRDEKGVWEGGSVEASPDFAGLAATWASAKTDSQAVMVPLRNTEKEQFEMLLAVDNGGKRRTEFIVLDFNYQPKAGNQSVGAHSFTLDSQDELSQYDVILLGDTQPDGGEGTSITSMTYASGKEGMVWTRNWQMGLSRNVYHLCDEVELSAGAAHFVLGEGSDGLEGTWISAESGKTLATHSLKEITGTPVAISSTTVAQDKGDELVVVVLTDEGELHLVHARQDADDVLTYNLEAEAGDLLSGRLANNGGGLANYRKLEIGSKIYFPPIQSRSTDQGDLHVAISVPGERGSEGLLLASWSAGEGTVDLSASPDSVELVAQGGRAFLSGGSGEKLTGAPVIFQRAGSEIAQLGSVSADGSAELTLAADGGWTVTTRGGQVYVQNAEGKETSVPLDPAAGVQARRIGEMCVLSGMLRSKSSSRWGLVTVSSEGVGTLDFNTALDNCGFDRDESDGGMTTFCTTVDDSNEAGVGAFQFSEKELPGAGEELTLDSSKVNTWTWTSGTWTGTGTHVFSSRVAVDDSVSSDADVSSVAKLSTEPATHDVVLQMPHGSDYACPVATWFVPGDSTDWSKNLASAILLDSSNEEDCSDLLRPEAAIDLSGEGPSTVLLSEPSSTEGYRDIQELVWDGEELLLLPAITVADWHSLEIADFDGDGLEELLIQQDPGADEDGTFGSDMSGMMLRGGGLKHLSQDIRAEVTQIKNAGKVAPGSDDNDVVGAVYELSDGSLDALTVSGTQGREVKKGNFTTVGVGNQPPPVLLSSWGAVLD